jgi:hypothetical protein
VWLFVVAVVVTISATFTASNSVPSSNIGVSAQLLKVTQLAPAGCSALTLTAVVQGSGKF